MTAYHTPGTEEASRRAGAVAYLRKPFALRDLANAIDFAAKARAPAIRIKRYESVDLVRPALHPEKSPVRTRKVELTTN